MTERTYTAEDIATICHMFLGAWLVNSVKDYTAEDVGNLGIEISIECVNKAPEIFNDVEKNQDLDRYTCKSDS